MKQLWRRKVCRFFCGDQQPIELCFYKKTMSEIWLILIKWLVAKYLNTFPGIVTFFRTTTTSRMATCFYDHDALAHFGKRPTQKGLNLSIWSIKAGPYIFAPSSVVKKDHSRWHRDICFIQILVGNGWAQFFANRWRRQTDKLSSIRIIWEIIQWHLVKLKFDCAGIYKQTENQVCVIDLFCQSYLGLIRKRIYFFYSSLRCQTSNYLLLVNLFILWLKRVLVFLYSADTYSRCR